MKETRRALGAFEDLCDLGQGASLTDLLAFYRDRMTRDPAYRPPTRILSQLKAWSSAHDWQNRRAERFEEKRAARREQIAQLEQDALLDRYAVRYRRIEVINELLDVLIPEAKDRALRWLRDVKGVGSGPNFEAVKVERFNGTIFDVIRGLLDDAAKEVGGRQTKVDVHVMIERERERVREEAEAEGLDADLAIAEFERIVGVKA